MFELLFLLITLMWLIFSESKKKQLYLIYLKFDCDAKVYDLLFFFFSELFTKFIDAMPYKYLFSLSVQFDWIYIQ